MNEALSAEAGGIMGFLFAALAAYAVRRAKLCTFGAIEDALIGGSTRRLKAFGVSLAIALLGTQALILTGIFSPGTTSLVPLALSWLSTLAGGIVFGIGMALVGTCSFGSLIRLGGGDLRALVVLATMGAVAYATARGLLSPLREELASHAISLADLRHGDIPNLLQSWSGFDLRLPITLAVGAALLVWALRDARFRQSRRLLLAGIALGVSIIAGWVITGVLSDPMASDYRGSSLSFVAPVGRLFFALIAGLPHWFDFGTGIVFGTIAGGGLGALTLFEWRWEAFDDHHEMRRHLVGGVLMGFGGVIASGCTIGQGLSAASLLAISAPFAVVGMVIGARLGVAFLVEGDVIPVLGRRLHLWISVANRRRGAE
ncbi:MAG: YeeE/YedE family protein [Ferrovibrio sp.]